MMMAGGGSASKKRRTRRTTPKPADPTAQLTDDLLVEILARVPYRSLCRCRCVSKRWRAVASHPDHRARLPQTLAGILYPKPHDAAGAASATDPEFAPPRYGFADVAPGTGGPHLIDIDPSFSFLPGRERERLVLVDCCDGLFLCRSYRFADHDDEFDYLVLNPATEKWVAVPVTRRWTNKVQTVRLGFDRAVSPHFYVFEFQLDMDDDEDDDDDDDWHRHVLGVKIYSSATGVWIHKQSRWSMEILLQIDYKSVFLNGVLYVVAIECVIGAVDVEGETWRIIEFPRIKDSPFHDTAAGFIDLSQGKLHFANGDAIFGDKLTIWVLEDKDSEEWALKHTVRFKHLVGMEHVGFGFKGFIIVSIHPDRNMVFFVSGRERTLMCYDMDSGKVCIIRNLGRSEDELFLPYVPLFSKSLPDGGNQ